MSKKIISLFLVIAMIAAVMTTAVVSVSAGTKDLAATGDDEWYVRGSFNNWEAQEAYKMSGPDAGGVFTLTNVAITAGQEFKVATADWGTSYPGSNYRVNESGTYTITFNSTTHAVTATETSASEDVYIVAGSEADIFGNTWSATDENNKMTKNADDTYSKTYTVTKAYSSVELKVTVNKSWNPSYPSDNYKFELTGAGSFTVTFDPSTQQVGVTGDIVKVNKNTYTVNFVNKLGWSTVNIHYWGGSSTDWPGTPMTPVNTTDSFGNTIYTAEIPSNIDGFLFDNGTGGDGNQSNNVTGADIVDGSYYAAAADRTVYRADSLTLSVAGYSLTLGDNIGVNFCLSVPAVYGPADMDVAFAWGDNKTATGTLTAVSNNNDYNYKTTCTVPARSMADKITMTVKGKNFDTAALTNKYAIVDYAATAATEYASRGDLKALLCDMLYYGGAVQTYFNYNTDNLASAAIATVDPAWSYSAPADTLQDNTTLCGYGGFNDFAGTYGLGIEYAGATMSTTSDTAINLFFNISDLALMEDAIVSVEGRAVEFKQYNTDTYYIAIDGISARNIFEYYQIDFTFTYMEGDDMYYASESFFYNAANYYNAIIAGNYPLTAQNVMRAMYNYSVSANNVLG